MFRWTLLSLNWIGRRIINGSFGQTKWDDVDNGQLRQNVRWCVATFSPSLLLSLDRQEEVECTYRFAVLRFNSMTSRVIDGHFGFDLKRFSRNSHCDVCVLVGLRHELIGQQMTDSILSFTAASFLSFPFSRSSYVNIDPKQISMLVSFLFYQIFCHFVYSKRNHFSKSTTDKTNINFHAWIFFDRIFLVRPVDKLSMQQHKIKR